MFEDVLAIDLVDLGCEDAHLRIHFRVLPVLDFRCEESLKVAVLISEVLHILLNFYEFFQSL
jgi:hypothetical protein